MCKNSTHCNERSKLDSEFLPGSFDTSYRRWANNYRTKGPERSVWSDTTSSLGGSNSDRSAFRHCFTARMDFHCSPTSPGRYALSKGTKVSASRNPGSRTTWIWEMVWRAAGLRCSSHLLLFSALSLICSYPCKCRSVLSRYEIAPAASVGLNYWITIASAHITAEQ